MGKKQSDAGAWKNGQEKRASKEQQNGQKNRAAEEWQNGQENRAAGGIQEEDGEQGQVLLAEKRETISLLTIIGEIEGHENLNSCSKTTKYEHLLPRLARIEDSVEVEGVLLLINTQGGDVSAGLALAEMIASLSKPTISLVIGDSHSIGVPLAVSADESFIVPTATMLIHPVRMSGMTIGAPQTYHYFQRIQDRITGFVADHSRIPQDKIEALMMNTADLTKDLGTLLVGEDAVRLGLIDRVGGIDQALARLRERIREGKQRKG